MSYPFQKSFTYVTGWFYAIFLPTPSLCKLEPLDAVVHPLEERVDNWLFNSLVPNVFK